MGLLQCEIELSDIVLSSRSQSLEGSVTARVDLIRIMSIGIHKDCIAERGDRAKEVGKTPGAVSLRENLPPPGGGKESSFGIESLGIDLQ